MSDIELWWTATGDGPPVVLCHGGPGLWDDLAPLAALLDDRFTVYRYDQRGCGRSPDLGPHTLAAYVDDLDRLRERVGHERWIVGGHSWGARLALEYALVHPDRVAGVCYVSGTGIGWEWNRAYHDEAAARRGPEEEARLAALKAKPDRSAEEEHELRVLTWHPDFADRARARELAAAEDRPFPINRDANAALVAELRAVPEAELARRCRALQVPVLVVHGAEDPRPVWALDTMVQALPDARVEIVPGAGHLPWVDAPARTATVLRAFAADLRRPQSQ